MLQELNTNTSSTIWAKITDGKIVTTAEATDEKAVKRINKLGKEVYERFYQSIAGRINTLTVEENKFGETEIKVGLQFGEKRGVLSFNLDSSYGRTFLHQIFNVDLTKNIIFQPWLKMTDEGKKRTALYLNYGKGVSVEYKLPEGTPEIKWVETKKGKVIDPVSKAEYDDYIVNKLGEFITSNNLNYNPEMPEHLRGLDEPLTKEEQKQLKEMKTKKAVIEEAVNDDDFFNSFG